VADKSNEIVAIPKLLDLLTIKGATVTIDAIGCQRKIADKIIAKGADYILALKANQGALYDDVSLFFTEQTARGFADALVSRHETVEKSHGRIETRITTATDDIAWLKESHSWPGLESIVMVESVREIGVHPGAKVERQTRFYITSCAADAAALGHAIRGHWGIENGLHWVMDMVFRHGHGLPRRRVPHPKDECARQLHNPQTHGQQPVAKSARQGQPPCQTTRRRMGRGLPRKPHRPLIPFTRFPWPPGRVIQNACSSTRSSLRQSPIRLAPVRDVDRNDDATLVIYRIEDAVAAHAEPPEFARSTQLLRCCRPRIVFEPHDGAQNPPAGWLIERTKVSANGAEVEGVGHSPRSSRDRP
jgi:predicted transposase YbfD/YdcC